MYAATVTRESGQFICAPATVEEPSEQAQSDELMENLMALTRQLVSEKTGGDVVISF